MKRVFIGSCLLGENVRYDGGNNGIESPVISKWIKEAVVLSGCPEVTGGLPVPRASAEIDRGDGDSVLNGSSSVKDCSGADVTDFFLEGTHTIHEQIKNRNVVLAVLKSGSPSCGNKEIYDGSFSGTKIPGKGVTAALFEREGVHVFNESELKNADFFYRMVCMETTNVSFVPIVPSHEDSLIQIQEENHDLIKLIEKNPDYVKEAQGNINYTDLPPGGDRNSAVNLMCVNKSGEIIGYVCSYTGYPNEMSLCIGALFLRPRFHGRNYGREIVAEIEQLAFSLGYHQVYVGVGLKNWKALRFWVRQGYNSVSKVSGDKTYGKNSFGFMELKKSIIYSV